MFSIVLSATILTAIFATGIDFKDCIRSPETTVNLTKSAYNEIIKKIPPKVLHYRPGVYDLVSSYMTFTPPMYVFVKHIRYDSFGIPSFQYGAVNNGTMSRMVRDENGTIYYGGLTKCTVYSNATINNDEPPVDKKTAEPESTLPENVRRKRYVDL